MGRSSQHGRAGGDAAADAQAAGHRHARLSQILHEELSMLLRDEVGDPRLADVAITSVALSVDYRNARVMFVEGGAARPGADRGQVERALARVAPFLRARLVDALDIKQVPQLRFVFDAGAEEERRVARRLRPA